MFHKCPHARRLNLGLGFDRGRYSSLLGGYIVGGENLFTCFKFYQGVFLVEL